LASKSLIGRLDTLDAAVLGLDPDRLTCTALADLGTARRDPRAIDVSDV
jgi:hypothetical protein